MTRTCERIARGIALIKPLLDSSQIFTRAEKRASCSAKIKDLLTIYSGRPPPFFISNVGRFLYSYQRCRGRGGGGKGRGDFVGLKVFNRIFSRFQKGFQGLLESALDV